MDLHVVSLDGLSRALLPGEPFTEFEERIKKYSRPGRTTVVSTRGEDPFYITDREAFSRGGYESGYIASPEKGNALLEAAREVQSAVADKP